MLKVKMTRKEFEQLDRLLAKHLGTGGYYDTLEVLKDFIELYVESDKVKEEVRKIKSLDKLFSLITALVVTKVGVRRNVKN